MRLFHFACTLLFVFGLGVQAAVAQDPAVKGQTEVVGGVGQFGTTYSLKNGFNFTILGARYSVDEYDAYNELHADADSKLFIIDIAIKNASSDDNFFNPEGLFTLVDDKGQLYQGGSLMLESKGSDSTSFTLKPGQGVGQPSLHDPLHMAWSIPAKARIAKIILNQGRLNTNEEVLRYPLVAPPADPKKATNPSWAAPLPAAVRDPKDTYGAVALDEGAAAVGTPVPSGQFLLNVVDISAPAGVQYGGNPPDDGKRYIVMTVTATSVSTRDLSSFDAQGANDNTYTLKDADGETYNPIGFRKPKADEDPDHKFIKGEPYTFRVFFAVPQSAKIVKAVAAAGGSRKWAYTLPGI